MPSIFRSALVASIFALATSVSAQSSSVQTASATNHPQAVQTLGCYSALDSSFVNQGSWTYQSSGYCQIICSNQFKNVMATSQGSNCYCGDHIPAQSNVVPNSTCSSPCNGYDQEDCGGDGTYTVYLSGMVADVETDSSSSSSAKPSTTSKSGSSSAGQSPSVITQAGQTIVVTASSTATSQSSGGGGSSKVGIAVGVVVGVLAIAAIVGGVIFFMKQRRRKAVEEEYKRNAANAEFIRQKSSKSETSSTTDNRLDQAATFTHRRQSIGSIADENDFSRRILQVSNSASGILINADVYAGTKSR